MRCGKALKALQRYLDGDVRGPERNALDRHLASCPACSRELRAYRSLLGAVAAWAEREVSPEFEGRLRARLEQVRPATPARAWLERWEERFSWRLRPALAATAAVAVAVGAWLFTPRPDSQPSTKPFVEHMVRHHEIITGQSPEQEAVDFSIAHSTLGSLSDPN